MKKKVRKLAELRKEIRDQTKTRGPYSHNIIGLCLRQIDEAHGRLAANQAVRELGLLKLGWREQPPSKAGDPEGDDE